jgi:hypothetical protein
MKVVGRARKFSQWSAKRIDDECRTAYAAYLAAVRDRHVAYYEERPAERSKSHPFAASERRFVFPPGFGHLAGAIAERSWHRHHLSGGSSQVLAIALLAAATRADPTLSWLPRRVSLGDSAVGLFEVELAPQVLNEQPRQTALDWLVTGPKGVLVAEAKFTEREFGTCSCDSWPQCASRVLERPYWRVANRMLGLSRRLGGGCALSLAYQPVRNLAAASAIAGPNRAATFLLLYDGRNPYFSGAGGWPGWVQILHELAAYSDVPFVDKSWQQLLADVRLDEPVLSWSKEKHGIVAQGSRHAAC